MSNNLTPEQSISLEAIRHNAQQLEWQSKRGQLYFEVGTIANDCHNGDLEPTKALHSMKAKVDTYRREYASLASMASRLGKELEQHSEELAQHCQAFRETAKLFNPFESYEAHIADRQAIAGLFMEVELLELTHASGDVIETFFPTIGA